MVRLARLLYVTLRNPDHMIGVVLLTKKTLYIECTYQSNAVCPSAL